MKKWEKELSIMARSILVMIDINFEKKYFDIQDEATTDLLYRIFYSEGKNFLLKYNNLTLLDIDKLK
jgi:hypothetical protein